MQEAYFSSSTPFRLWQESYRDRVERLVTPARFEHILRVARLARTIAEGNGFDEGETDASLLAALLHDAARDLAPNELFRLAPPLNEFERRNPLSVHGRASRRLAREWGVSDERVLTAIEGHVFGVPLGHRVGMAVYTADVSEPGRGVNDDIRERAVCDLEGAYRLAVQSKVDYLRQHGKAVHPETLKVYESILDA